LVTVAPPVNFFDFAGLGRPSCPWLLVQGKSDEIVPCSAVEEWVSELPEGPEAIFMDGVGHFFHKRLNDLRSAIEQSVDATPQASKHVVNQN